MPHIIINAQSTFLRPGLHVWHNNRVLFHSFGEQTERPKWWRFTFDLPRHQTIQCKLFAYDENLSSAILWEEEVFNRSVEVAPGEELPAELWFLEGSQRVLLNTPFDRSCQKVVVHLITKTKYTNGQLHGWTPERGNPFNNDKTTTDIDGWPVFEVELTSQTQHAFNFMFHGPGENGEQKSANRTWCSGDGPEIWTHSEAPAISSTRPFPRKLLLHVLPSSSTASLMLHVWQDGHGYAEQITGATGQDGWMEFVKDGLFTGIPYGLMLVSRTADGDLWEHEDARRWVVLDDSCERWTIEGDSSLFEVKPQCRQKFRVTIAGRDPRCAVQDPDAIEVKINKAAQPSGAPAERISANTWEFTTWPQLITGFRFGSGSQWEEVYHMVKSADRYEDVVPIFVVLGRAPCLAAPPPDNLFADPPFPIGRPGVAEDDGYLQFVLHAPWCSRVRLWGDWLQQDDPLPDLQCSLDGSYWWIRIKVAEIESQLPVEFKGDYHGARYHFVLHDITGTPAYNLLNRGRTLQDPAAQWVESSNPYGNSRLVNHKRYNWHSTLWQIPGWEFLNIYQLHAQRFTDRNQDLCPLDRITKEVESGYFERLGITAIQLLPVGEFSGDNGWGYNPTYFYAIENGFGGPEALKRLVDTCHCHGIAVILDVVFNHIGCQDNILYEASRDTYSKGDSQWGLIPNYDNEQCRIFFEQSLVYLHEQYRVDGYRFDHTRTIIKAGEQDWFVRQPGSKQGWEFLHGVRRAVKGANGGIFMYGEHLPSEPAVTNFGGPLDSQTCEEFKEGIFKVVRGEYGQLSNFAAALSLSQSSYDNWYKVVNYACSHDGAGNDGRRTAFVGGLGQGLRRNKVAAAAIQMCRGVPYFFMGEEYGETEPFRFNSEDTLKLSKIDKNAQNIRVLEWWKTLVGLRRNNWKIMGGSPLAVHFAQDSIIAFSRGSAQEYFVVLNFGPEVHWKNLGMMNLPGGTYKELWNSTWPQFQVEWEDMHENGGWGAYLHPGCHLHIPDYGAVILERREI
ncbi:MAG: alpha-amylase family glycosyl hydrolase [Pseudomonadota bacterium]